MNPALDAATVALLDYFAGFALAGLLNNNGLLAPQTAASKAYAYAQAMVDERTKFVPAPAADAPVPEVRGRIFYATGPQKEEITRLLNNPTITRQEKTKLLVRINQLTQEEAEFKLTELRATIDLRENGKCVVADKMVAA